MERLRTIMLVAEEGVEFKVSVGKGGEIVIKAQKISYSADYTNPPIPEGYIHVCGEWNNGYVIERISDGSQFVWIPVGDLDSDGTVGGFPEKFGRRDYMNNIFSSQRFNESSMDDENLSLQVESVKKYGGFYISRYDISKNAEGKPQSVEGVMPWVWINCEEAMSVASSFENKEDVTSHLTYGAEYDSILAWLIKSEAKSLFEITKDSTEWGNFLNNENAAREVVETGSRIEWCANNIYDLAGNIGEWTQEKDGIGERRVMRGGHSNLKGNVYPVASRYSNYSNRTYAMIGFRIALYIK